MRRALLYVLCPHVPVPKAVDVPRVEHDTLFGNRISRNFGAKRSADRPSKRSERYKRFTHRTIPVLPTEGDQLVHVREHGIDVGTGNRTAFFPRSGGILLLLEPP